MLKNWRDIRARLRRSVPPALVPAILLPISLAIHEFITFGYRWEFASDPTLAFGCTYRWGVASILLGNAFYAGFLMIVFMICAVLFYPKRAYLAALAALYTGFYFTSAFTIPFEYRACFGATWLNHEPFLELFWDPALTLGLFVTGLSLSLYAAYRLAVSQQTYS